MKNRNINLRFLLAVGISLGTLFPSFSQGLKLDNDVSLVLEENVQLVVDGNIELDPSVVDFHSNPNSKIHLTGDFITSGKQVVLDGSLFLNGTSRQILSGILAIETMIIDNAKGLELNGLIDVRKTLNFLNGMVITDQDAFTILESTQIDGVGEDSYVQGLLNISTNSTTGSKTLNFPIGTSEEYRPLTLKFNQPNASNNLYTAEVKSVDFPNLTKEGTIHLISQKVFWKVTSTSDNMQDGSISLYVRSSDGLSLGQAIVVKESSSSWSNLGVGEFSGIPGSITSDISFSDLGFFALGESSNVITPTEQPTNLLFSNHTSSSLSLSFTKATSNPTGYLILRKGGSAPTGAPADGTTYTAGNTLGNGTVAYVGTSNTFNNTGLASETTYYYLVFSYNGTGTSVKYLTVNPLQGNAQTLAAEPANQPTNLAFSDITSNSCTVSFTSATSSPTGYLVVRRINAAPTGIPEDGTAYSKGSSLGNGTVVYAGSSTTIDETGLSASTTYYYKVYSFNGSGEVINYRASSPLSDNVKTKDLPVNPPVISEVNIPDQVEGGTSTFEVSAKVTDDEGVASVNCMCRKFGDGEDQWQATVMTSSGDDLYHGSVSVSGNLSKIGGECYIEAIDVSDQPSKTSPQDIIMSYPDLLLSYNSFGDQVHNYRIIAIPYQLNDMSIQAIFGGLGEYKKAWRIVHINNDNYSEYPSLSRIEHGQGYWLIIKESADVNLGTGIPVNTNPFIMNLTNGWNQIGNPYPFTLPWNNVVSYNGDPTELEGLKLYRGNWSEGSQLNVQEGLVYLDAPSLQLQIPANIESLTGGRIAIESVNPSGFVNGQTNEWQVTLTLQSGELTYNIGGIGMMEDASEHKDPHDQMSLPRFMTYLEYYTLHPEHSWGKFTRDIQPIGENSKWDIEISHNTGNDQVAISWDPQLVGQLRNDLVLYDPSTNEILEMAHENATTIQTSNDTGTISILYGDNAFIKENLIPNALVLDDPYPNPFTRFVNIPVGLPSNLDRMYVDVYNIFGQHVASIAINADEEHQTVLHWDGRDSASNELPDGVYLLKIRDEQLNPDIKKIIKK